MSKLKMGFWIVALVITLGVADTPPVFAAADVLETFEGGETAWAVRLEEVGGGDVSRSNSVTAAGSYSARLAVGGSGQKAEVYVTYSDAAASHPWRERPGTWRWQRASVYVPSSTVASFGANEYLTLAGMYASSNPNTYGWYLRVEQNGALSVVGTPPYSDTTTFHAYGSLPLDRWVELEIGLHSQNGDGVKRAFAFLVNGSFYGWYRQGRMESETYDRAAVGILATNSPDDLVVYVDQWRTASTDRFPDGPDNRSTANLQAHDFRNLSGVQVQYDWATWEYSPTLDAAYGLYAGTTRLQAGHNLDRMPSVASGWGEIEMDWPNGTPACSSTCSAMIGFRKEINREENLEVIPVADNRGVFSLVFEAWADGGPVEMAKWRMPDAEAAPGQNMPEPGDIVRARWEQIGSAQLNVRASYYDVSAETWYTDIINHTFTATNVSGVNFLDGYHEAASITIDSTFYSIRRFTVGTLATYPVPVSAPTHLNPPDQSSTSNTRPLFRWSSVSGAAGYEFQADTVSPPAVTLYTGSKTAYTPPAPLLYGHTYYWRIRAYDRSGVPSSWSNRRSVRISDEFTTDASPQQNVYSSSRPTLRWNPITWAAGYEVQVDRQSTFAEPIFDADNLDARTLSAVVAVTLADGVYYWRVRAKRGDGQWGKWSASDTFVVDVMP